MANTYKKPETKVVKFELQQMIAQSATDAVTGVKIDTNATTGGMGAKGFDFFAFEEEEETQGKSDDDDSWEDWEEEE